MTTRIRQFVVASAFAASVAVTVTGATLRGETREAASVAETCQKADWPLIPVECLDGAADRRVRVVTGNEAASLKFDSADVSDRFAVAFQ